MEKTLLLTGLTEPNYPGPRDLNRGHNRPGVRIHGQPPIGAGPAQTPQPGTFGSSTGCQHKLTRRAKWTEHVKGADLRLIASIG